MNPRRILAEARRETLRSSTLMLAAAFGAATVILGVFALSEDATDLYLSLVYLHLPLLFTPLGAYRGARCRERGLAAVATTTPSSLSSTLLGKLLALGALLLVGLAVSVPTSALLVAPETSQIASILGPMLAWGTLLGAVAIVVGLLVGYARAKSPRSAVTLAFVVFLGWLVLGLQRKALLAWADSAMETQLLQAVLHASPLVWALEASGEGTLGLAASHQMAGLVVLGGSGLLALVSVVVGLQHADGWLPLPEAHPVALVLVAVAVLAVVGALATWDYPPPDVPGLQVGQGEVGADADGSRERGPSGSFVALLPTMALSGLLAAASVWLPRRLNAWHR